MIIRRLSAGVRREVAFVRSCPWPLAALVWWILAVWALLELTTSPRFALTGSGEPGPAVQMLALIPAAATGGEPWRFFSLALVHAGLLHLAVNCWSLASLGTLLDRLAGSAVAMFTIVAGVFTGSLAAAALVPDATGVGASAAVFALLGAALVIGWPMLNRAGRASLAVFLAVNSAAGLVVPGVLWSAHFGGLAAGVAVGGAYRLRSRYARRQ